jgi:hypothetical protein
MPEQPRPTFAARRPLVALLFELELELELIAGRWRRRVSRWIGLGLGHDLGEIDKVDAVCARLEHVEGQSVEVYLPYRKERLSEYAYGEIFATPGEARIFVE